MRLANGVTACHRLYKRSYIQQLFISVELTSPNRVTYIGSQATRFSETITRGRCGIGCLHADFVFRRSIVRSYGSTAANTGSDTATVRRAEEKPTECISEPAVYYLMT
jgi:hypothetical protein